MGTDPGETTEPGRPRRRWGRRLVGSVVIIGLLYFGWAAASVALAANRDDRTGAEAIVVLGAAQYDGTPSPVLQARLDHAFELWDAGVAPMIVLTGSKQGDDRFTEAYAGFRALLDKGVPEDDMAVVTDGVSTWESMAATSRVLGTKGIDDVVMVSDGYHNRRLQGIASELGLEATVSPATAGVPVSRLWREAALVGTGELAGYRRIDRFS